MTLVLKKITSKKICVLASLFILFFSILGCDSPLDKLSLLYKKTTSDYEKTLQKNPGNHSLRLKLARFYYQFNDYQKVKSLLLDDALSQTKVKNKDAKQLLAKTLAHLKEYAGAYEIFEQFPSSKDQEYLYLYALTCEEKNLFPQAIKIYQGLKAPYEQLAQARIEEIGIKREDKAPAFIKQLLGEEEAFLSQIDKEEAAVLLADEVIEVKDDNTSVFYLYVVEKVLKEKGKELGEVAIGYDSTDERIELEYARTITPSSRVVYAGKENIRDVSKYLNFPLYSNARVLIVSMPAVEIGSIIEYKLKIYSSKLINNKDFTFIYSLKENYPIARANFKLIVPKERIPNFKFINEDYAQGFNLKPLLEEREGKKIYSWEFNHLPPIIPEDEMPSLSLINPAIIISSFSSWEQIYSWWHGLFKDKLALSKEIEEFTKNLIKDGKTDYEKAEKIYEFCAQNIRYVGVEYGESGYEPHRAEDIFWNRYGDCKDKATLLAAMLRSAGLNAQLVLIPTREAYSIDEGFPSLNFNHAICAYRHNGQLIFMDATSTTTPFFDLPLDDQERNVLVFFDDGYKVLTTPQITDNEVVYATKIEIDGFEDAKIEREITTKGFFAQAQRFYFKYSHPQEIEDDIQKRIVQISPYAKLISYNIENVDDFDKPPILKYSFATEKILSPAKDLRIPPYLGDIEINPAYVGKQERFFPIEFKAIYREVSKVEITLPPNLAVKFLPQDFFLDTVWFGFKAAYHNKENSIDFSQEFAIKKRFVEKEEYKDFKKELEKVADQLREKLILEARE